MVILIRGRLRPEKANPISRITQGIYLPILKFWLRFRWWTIAVNLIFLIVTFPLATHLGSQFMPPLFEGSTLYMPTAPPGISIEQAKVHLQQQDRILRSFPKVASVFGAVGRSDSATDNAPLMANACFHHAAVIEWNSDACETFRENQRRHAHHIEEWPLHEADVRTFDYGTLNRNVMVVSGGPPCQPFSMGSKHKGYKDDREMFPEAVVL